MAREELVGRYYDKILLSKNYVDTRRPIQVCVADYMAQVFFGQDFKRVVYSNPEFAFRKRVEQLALGIEENIFISNVQLPFASFYLADSPKIIKSVSASEWMGYYDEWAEQYMHFIGIEQSVKVQFYFDNTDDATIAYNLALTEMHTKKPMRYVDEIYWRNKTVLLPVYIVIDNITAGNASFAEQEKLNKARMFAMTLDLKVETVQLHINKGNGMVQLPFKWNKTGRVDTWQEGEIEYYTRKCTLVWARKQWNIDFDTKPESKNEELENLEEVLCSGLIPCDENTFNAIAKFVPNQATTEMIEGYFKEPTDILFNRLRYNEPKTTIDEKGEVTAWIDTVIKPSTHQYWYSTEVHVPGRSKGKIEMETCKTDHILIDGLHPNSEYTVFFINKDLNGNFNTIPLTFTTPVWEKEKLPVADSGEPEDLNNRQLKEPEVIVPHGLIGLEL